MLHRVRFPDFLRQPHIYYLIQFVFAELEINEISRSLNLESNGLDVLPLFCLLNLISSIAFYPSNLSEKDSDKLFFRLLEICHYQSALQKDDKVNVENCKTSLRTLNFSKNNILEIIRSFISNVSKFSIHNFLQIACQLH